MIRQFPTAHKGFMEPGSLSGTPSIAVTTVPGAAAQDFGEDSRKPTSNLSLRPPRAYFVEAGGGSFVSAS